MSSDYQLCFEVSYSHNEYNICFALNHIFEQKYNLIRFIRNNKTHWGLYKEGIDFSNLFSNIHCRIPCITLRPLNGLRYKTQLQEEILDKTIIFDTIYDCLQYSVTNKYPQKFIDDINTYFNQSINMNYIQ